jgi:hypothetical protein
MAEEIHASTESLTHQTENLMIATGRFQLEEQAKDLRHSMPQSKVYPENLAGTVAPLPPKSAKRPSLAKSPLQVAKPGDAWDKF